MAQQDGKTEAPTPKRRREARKRGQVAKSIDISTWAQVLVAVTLLEIVVRSGRSLLERTMVDVRHLVAAPDVNAGMRLFGSSARSALITVLPLAGAMVAVAVVTTMAQTKGLVAGSKLKPDFKLLNPFTGIKRLFSKLVVWEGFKTVVKMAIFSFLSWRVGNRTAMGLVGEPTTLAGVVGAVGGAAARLIRQLAMVGLGIALFDWAFQYRQLMKQLRMTKEEIKQEGRESEGDPMLKAARRRRQIEMSRNRMMADVRTASAVIVNPTHFAVAVRYAPGSGAPTVVASGTDHVAARIKAEAARHRVPVVRDPPLARALYAACDIGDEIPAELYEAVARVLAFVMHLARRARWSDDEITMPGTSPLGTTGTTGATGTTADTTDNEAVRARTRERRFERRRQRRAAPSATDTEGRTR
jgi:flagellar biosynthetic protein FlhB